MFRTTPTSCLSSRTPSDLRQHRKRATEREPRKQQRRRNRAAPRDQAFQRRARSIGTRSGLARMGVLVFEGRQNGCDHARPVVHDHRIVEAQHPKSLRRCISIADEIFVPTRVSVMVRSPIDFDD